MFKNSKKQGDAGLGQAIAYFTMNGYDVALPLTDSADWDMIVEIDGELKRVQVKTSSQVNKIGVAVVNTKVSGGNKSGSNKPKMVQAQSWDLLFVYHFVTTKKYLIPKTEINSKGQMNIGSEKFTKYLVE